MKIEWLVADMTAIGSPDRAECASWGRFWLGVFLANPGLFCGRGATFWCRNPLLNADNFTQGHLMKMEWLVADVTAVGSPDRTECIILGVILAGRFYGQFRLYLWSGSREQFVAKHAIFQVILVWCCFGQFRPYLWPGSHFVMQEPHLEP